MKVYTARAVTDSADTYIFVFKTRPTSIQIIEKVRDLELAADLDWYKDTTSVYIEETELLE